MKGQKSSEFFEGGRERRRHLYMLRELTKAEDAEEESVPAESFEAFRDMLVKLEGGRADELTSKQLEWVGRTCERLDIPLLPPITAADVPRGAEVPLAPVLQNLPKRPPGRR